jgi:hypothetical protein
MGACGLSFWYNMVILTNIPFVPDSTLPYGIEFYIYSQSPKTGGAASNVIYWDPNLHFVEFFIPLKITITLMLFSFI